MANSAEYDTLRIFLGLSYKDVAFMHGVSDRAIRYWIKSDEVPADAMDQLVDYNNFLDVEADLLYRDAIAEALEFGDDHVVKLVRFRRNASALQNSQEERMPVGAYAIVVQRAYELIHDHGIAAEIVWSDD